MIDIGFVNLILIIADNVSSSEEPGNPYLFAIGALHSPCISALVVSGSPCSPAFVEFTNFCNSIPNFFAYILANLFSNFSINAFSNLAVDLVPSSIVPILS